jgi:hypothetical protein
VTWIDREEGVAIKYLEVFERPTAGFQPGSGVVCSPTLCAPNRRAAPDFPIGKRESSGARKALGGIL